MLIFSAFSLSPFLFLFLLSCSGSWPLPWSLCFQWVKLSDHPSIPYPPFFFADVFLLKILAFLTMGAPKQKWTAEEEAAVKAGVRKHGAGKWQTILRDPDFSDVLRSCSNVDLKDKRRNINVTASGLGSREKARLDLKRNPQTPKRNEKPVALNVLAEDEGNNAEPNPHSVRNFREDPPGLFRGRGEHPKMGKLKKSICPSHITMNIGKDAPIPECPIPGERWKEIRHDNTITWLAFWNDPINLKEFKYVFLAASSTLKGQSDKEKYEKARMLKGGVYVWWWEMMATGLRFV